MLELKKTDKDNVSEVRKKEVEKKLTLVHRILPKRGHKIWKYNHKEDILSECEFTEDTKEIAWNRALHKDLKQKNRKIIVEENCIYFNALNKKNALKILRRDYKILK